jgi:hypothetical protein
MKNAQTKNKIRRLTNIRKVKAQLKVAKAKRKGC